MALDAFHGRVEENRVGICVHLPLEGFTGARYELLTGRGTQRRLILPAEVAPQSPCTDIRTMRFDLPRRHRLELTFAGDEFEIEDQRNWIDGSFKIYSRPLARGYPYMIEAGETFSQSLTVRLLAPTRPAAHAHRKSPAAPVTVRIGKKLPHVAPTLGLGLPRDFAPATATETAALSSLRIAHVRADFQEFGRGLDRRVRHAVAAAACIGVPLEIAACVGEKSAVGDIAALARALRTAGARVARVLIFGSNGRCLESRTAFNAAQRAFGPTCAAGTDFNFAELSRGRASLPAARAVTFAAIRESRDPAIGHGDLSQVRHVERGLFAASGDGGIDLLNHPGAEEIDRLVVSLADADDFRVG